MLKIVTSESVNIGHPDKTCDTIADSFLDEALKQDPRAQMAVECAIKNDKLFVYGEATTTAVLDYAQIAKTTLKEIGYENEFDVVVEVSRQSPDINQAVEKKEVMANDQGIVYGYATNETAEFMPLPIIIAHKLMKIYDDYRRITKCYFADAKSQVSVCYDDNKPTHVETIVVSVSHTEELDHETIFNDIKSNIYFNTFNNTMFE